MASSQKSAAFNHQGITDPYETATECPSVPRTPSTLYEDNFDVTLGTNTTDSFNDSGFYSNLNVESTPHGAQYRDWVLFEDNLQAPSLDTSSFFADADASTPAAYDDFRAKEDDDATYGYPQPSFQTSFPTPPRFQLSHSPYDPSYEVANAAAHEDLFNNVRRALQGYQIASPPSSPSQPPKTPILQNLYLDQEMTSPLEMWWASPIERNESIAYKMEQQPYPAREHLMPLFRQQPPAPRRSTRKHRCRN